MLEVRGSVVRSLTVTGWTLSPSRLVNITGRRTGKAQRGSKSTVAVWSVLTKYPRRTLITLLTDCLFVQIVLLRDRSVRVLFRNLFPAEQRQLPAQPPDHSSQVRPHQQLFVRLTSGLMSETIN